MRSLILWHLHFLLTKKTRIFMLMMCVVTLMMLAYLTKSHEPLTERILSRSVFEQDYVLGSLYLIKLGIMVTLMYVSLQLWHLCNYDIVLLQRISRNQLFYSKWITSIIIVGIYILIYTLYFFAFGYFSGYKLLQYSFISVFIHLFILMIFYSALMVLISTWFKHIFFMFCIFLGSMIANMTIDYALKIDTLPLGVLLINSIFINVHIIENLQLSTILHLRTIIIMSACMLFGGQYIHTHRDF